MGRYELKVPGGKLLRAECRVEGRTIKKVKLSGDFFLHPEESIAILEERLTGISAEKTEIEEIVKEFIKEGNIFIGLNPEHIVEAVLKAAQKPE